MSIRRPRILIAPLIAAAVATGLAAAPAHAGKPTYAHKMEIGQLLYFNGDVDRAIGAFKAAAELNPKAFEPHLNLLNLYIQRGGDNALENASVECSEVIKRKPNNKEVHLILGHILRTQAGMETEPDKMKVKLEEALKEVSLAEQLGAPKAMCENTIGLIDLQKGDTDAALEHIEKAIKYQPVFPDAHLVRAVLLFKGVNRVEAKGQDTTIYVNDLNSPEMKKKLDEVLHELDIAIEQKPKNPEAYNTKADIVFAMGKQVDALELYRKAAEQEPRYAQAWAGVGNCEAQLGGKATDSEERDKHYKLAREAYQKAQRLKPGDKNIVYGLAIMLERTGDLPDAIGEFQHGLMLENDPAMKAQITLHIQQLQQIALGQGSLGNINTSLSTTDVSAKLLNSAEGGSSNVGPGLFSGGAFDQNYANLIKIKPPAGKKETAE